jgi:CAAX protease family protein
MTEPEIPPPPPPEPREATVPVWAPFAALLAVLVIVSITAAAVYGVVKASDPSIKSTDDLPDGATLALTFFQDLVFVFGAWISVKLALGSGALYRLGLRPVRSWREALKWAGGAYAIFWIAAIVLALVFGDPKDQNLVTDLKEEDSTLILIGWAILICVLAPVVEEIFFRGFMFGAFVRRMPLVWAALLDGLVFGLGHAPAAPIQLIALGAFGVGLCLLYWRTQSIIPCMALHALNNSITFGATKDLDAGLFAAVVVLSVGTVIAGATAVARRTAVAA